MRRLTLEKLGQLNLGEIYLIRGEHMRMAWNLLLMQGRRTHTTEISSIRVALHGGS
jgi:hypothetical protein